MTRPRGPKSYDIVVIGGGPAGRAAAVAAAVRVNVSRSAMPAHAATLSSSYEEEVALGDVPLAGLLDVRAPRSTPAPRSCA